MSTDVDVPVAVAQRSGRVRGPDSSGRSGPRQVLRYVLLIVLGLVFLSPLIFMIVTSFKTRQEAGGIPPSWIPNPFTTQA